MRACQVGLIRQTNNPLGEVTYQQIEFRITCNTEKRDLNHSMVCNDKTQSIAPYIGISQVVKVTRDRLGSLNRIRISVNNTLDLVVSPTTLIVRGRVKGRGGDCKGCSAVGADRLVFEDPRRDGWFCKNGA